MPYPDSKYPPAPHGHAPSGTFADMEKRHFAGLTERDLRSRQRLLAAAPELLELVRTARVIVESAGHMDLSVRMWNAIAKAEGRE